MASASMESVGQRSANLPGKYCEDEVQELDRPLFVHPEQTFNPNLPPGVFPSLDDPLPREHQLSSIYFVDGKDTRVSQMTPPAIDALPGSPPVAQHLVSRGPAIFRSNNVQSNDKQQAREQKSQTADGLAIFRNSSSHRFTAKGHPGEFDNIPGFDVRMADSDEDERPNVSLPVSDNIPEWKNFSEGMKLRILDTTITHFKMRPDQAWKKLQLDTEDIQEVIDLCDRNEDRKRQEEIRVEKIIEERIELRLMGDHEAADRMYENGDLGGLLHGLDAASTPVISKSEIGMAKKYIKQLGIRSSNLLSQLGNDRGSDMISHGARRSNRSSELNKNSKRVLSAEAKFPDGKKLKLTYNGMDPNDKGNHEHESEKIGLHGRSGLSNSITAGGLSEDPVSSPRLINRRAAHQSQYTRVVPRPPLHKPKASKKMMELAREAVLRSSVVPAQPRPGGKSGLAQYQEYMERQSHQLPVSVPETGSPEVPQASQGEASVDLDNGGVVVDGDVVVNRNIVVDDNVVVDDNAVDDGSVVVDGDSAVGGNVPVGVEDRLDDEEQVGVDEQVDVEEQVEVEVGIEFDAAGPFPRDLEEEFRWRKLKSKLDSNKMSKKLSPVYGPQWTPLNCNAAWPGIKTRLEGKPLVPPKNLKVSNRHTQKSPDDIPVSDAASYNFEPQIGQLTETGAGSVVRDVEDGANAVLKVEVVKRPRGRPRKYAIGEVRPPRKPRAKKGGVDVEHFMHDTISVEMKTRHSNAHAGLHAAPYTSPYAANMVESNTHTRAVNNPGYFDIPGREMLPPRPYTNRSGPRYEASDFPMGSAEFALAQARTDRGGTRSINMNSGVQQSTTDMNMFGGHQQSLGFHNDETTSHTNGSAYMAPDSAVTPSSPDTWMQPPIIDYAGSNYSGMGYGDIGPSNADGWFQPSNIDPNGPSYSVMVDGDAEDPSSEDAWFPQPNINFDEPSYSTMVDDAENPSTADAWLPQPNFNFDEPSHSTMVDDAGIPSSDELFDPSTYNFDEPTTMAMESENSAAWPQNEESFGFDFSYPDPDELDQYMH